MKDWILAVFGNFLFLNDEGIIKRKVPIENHTQYSYTQLAPHIEVSQNFGLHKPLIIQVDKDNPIQTDFVLKLIDNKNQRHCTFHFKNEELIGLHKTQCGNQSTAIIAKT